MPLLRKCDLPDDDDDRVAATAQERNAVDDLDGAELGMRPVLLTPRLSLREMSLDDLDFIAAMLADPEVMQYYPKCYTREEATGWIEAQMDRYRRDGYGFWLASDLRSGEPIGQAGVVRISIESRPPSLAYMIHRPFWRRGYGTETAAAGRDYIFDTLGEERCITLIRPENVASRGVAEKLGMKPERTVDYHGFVHLIYAVGRKSACKEERPA